METIVSPNTKINTDHLPRAQGSGSAALASLETLGSWVALRELTSSYCN